MTPLVPHFLYSLLNEQVIHYAVSMVRVEGHVVPLVPAREYVYTRTTPEPVLGLYEYELLGERG
jgi:hypothetical protein